MFEFIRHPILTVRVIRHIASQLTPEDLAQLNASTNPEGRKDLMFEIQNRITEGIS